MGNDETPVTLQSVLYKLSQIDGKLDRVIELTQHHERELYGNGREGMVLTVDRIRAKVGTLVWMATALSAAGLYAVGEKLWLFLTH